MRLGIERLPRPRGPWRRRARDGVLLGLALIGAGFWFGASGVALGVLWWRAHSAGRARLRAGPGSHAPLLNVEPLLHSPTLVAVHLTPWRALFVDRHHGRVELFVDELPPALWARLRRQAFELGTE